MTEKELRHLKRVELLELLVEQSKQVEELEARLQEAEEKLKNREILIETTGSIAEAALKLNGVFEAAQAAADQYLENIKRANTGINEEEKTENGTL